ncbi:AI-2E family transporter [Candidatus Peregrinibacteria bacterium]|nr:AI-2E family transporter [Candidatus Peregrinibacteria bacterium]
MGFLNRSTKTFLKNSQKKINELKKKLEELKESEHRLDKEEKALKSKAPSPKNEVRVVLSVDSVVRSTIAILLVLALVYILGIIKGIIIIFLVALFLAAAFNPAIDKMEKKKIPRPIGIIFMYVIVLGIFVLMITSLVPIIARQTASLGFSVKDIIHTIVNGTDSDSWIIQKIQPVANQIWASVDQTQVTEYLSSSLSELAFRLTNFASNAIGAVFAIFNGLFNMLLVLIITFFMVVSSKNTTNFFHSLFPHRYSGYISEKSKQISIRIGSWIRGQVLLAIIMGIISYIIFSIMGLNYALTLSMVSALAEFIPYLGPLITFVSAALIALNQDPIILLWLIPVYIILQFLEGNLLIPLIIGKSMGMNPIVVLFALLSGATIGYSVNGSIGLALVGMIIAVPVANIISMFVSEYTDRHK